MNCQNAIYLQISIKKDNKYAKYIVNINMSYNKDDGKYERSLLNAFYSGLWVL